MRDVIAWLRSALFLLMATVWTVVCGTAFIPWLLGSRVMALYPQRVWSRGMRLLFRGCLGIRMTISGLEHIPPGACLIAPKHQSAWETVAFLSVIPDTVFALKKELLWIPFIGQYLWRSAHVPLDRGSGTKAMRALLAAADRAAALGCRIVVFPEGTRTTPGTAPELKPGIVGLYRHLGLPVVPVALQSGHVWPRNSFLKRPGVVAVRVLPPIGPGLGKAELLSRLHVAINLDPTARDDDAARVPAPPVLHP